MQDISEMGRRRKIDRGKGQRRGRKQMSLKYKKIRAKRKKRGERTRRMSKQLLKKTHKIRRGEEGSGGG